MAALTQNDISSAQVDLVSKGIFARLVTDIAAASGGVAATTAVAGVVKEMTTIAPCTIATDGTSVGTQFNALLLQLRAAGHMV
jgi:hypothetical protein